MGLKSFKAEERSEKATLPTAMSVGRGIGGIALGVLLGKNAISPTNALEATATLAALDLEGVVIRATDKFKRLQNVLRIIPTSFGRVIDPVMDKVFAVSVLGGAIAGGEIPEWEAGSILATEAATTGATGYVKYKGGEPETSIIGTWGFVARCGVMVTNIASKGIENGLGHELLVDGGVGLTGTALVLGTLSCLDIIKNTELPTDTAI